jgi:hypothetical protein
MNSYVILTIATMMLVAATTIAAISTPVLAITDPQRNDFGEGAAFFGGTGQMGTHSREGGAAGTAPYDGSDAFDSDKGRTGIGAIGHPADVANQLCSTCDDQPRP